MAMFEQKRQKEHLKKVKQKAGARYTPELNVNLPISEVFDGISRTKPFYTTIRGKYGELRDEFNYVTSRFENKKLQKEYDKIKESFNKLCTIIEGIKVYKTEEIPWEEIKKESKKLNDNLWKFSDKLRKEKEAVKDIKTPPRKDGRYQQSPSEKFNSDIHHIYKTQELIRYFEQLSSSDKAKLSNHPFLLLTGSAGTGKTHLLCDIAEHRTKNGLHTFVIFGEYFSNKEDFWSQFFTQIELENKSKNEFLAELNNLGQQNKSRSLIIIDALNENIAHAPNFWRKKLYGVIQDIKKYPNIALVVSVRNGFEKNVLLKKTEKELIKVEHHGFPQEKIWDALSHFFQHYNITFPEIPLLHPEFSNPLFLKFFCEKNKNSTPIIKGGNALKDVFEDFVIEVGLEVLKEINEDATKRTNGKNILWDGIIKDIALWMAQNGETRITEKELENIVKENFPNNNKEVVSLMERRVLINKSEYNDKTYYAFSYNKFSDHIIVRSLLASVDSEKRLEEFNKGGKIGKAIQKYKYNHGIIEALCIQVPEFLKKNDKKELFELAPYILEDNNFEYPFKESLIWRDPDTIDEKVIDIISRDVKKKSNFFLEPILSLASFPDNPLNAELLDSLLKDFSLPNRDSWWSTFLHYQYGKKGAVDRLLEWSWSNQDKKHLNDESIFLTAIALSWFLSTPNRFVRDKATKGLVCLLQNRIYLLPVLLEKFKNVDDPYISERLYAVAYGCVLRNKEDVGDLKILSEWVYENVFKDNQPPVHILLRDYARGVIEVSLRRGINLKINEDNITPPYQSNWPKRIPTEKTLKQKYYSEDFFKDKNKDRGFLDIWLSVMYNFGSLGDFGNYVVNSHLYLWSGRKIGENVIDRKKLFEDFLNDLNSDQQKLWENCDPIITEDSDSDVISSDDEIQINIKVAIGRKKESEVKKAIKTFRVSLPTGKRAIFQNEIFPYLDHNLKLHYNPAENFDSRIAQRWIFNRVAKLGYNPNLHGHFDKYVNSHISDRREHKAERIGKKYQWIAYHEFMALVSDHFEFKGDSWNNSKEEYKGAWHPYIRDIDPSFTLKNDDHIKSTLSFSDWKSNQGKYDAWGKNKTDMTWLKSNTDLPNPKKIIQPVDNNKNEWLLLEGFLNWKEKTPPEHKEYDIPHREVWYMLKSYIVKKNDAVKFFNWAKRQNFMGRWMPESNDFYEVFLGEYPNSTAFDNLREDYNIWTKSCRGNNDLQIPVVVTDDSYLNEFTLDCSHSGSVSIKLPCKWLVNEMNLNHRFLDGRFYDTEGNLVTIATSVFEENFPSALLINKKVLKEFLDKNDYSIIWTLLGEKQLIGGSLSGKDFVGRLEISGAYTLSLEGNIVGKSNNKFKK